VASGPTQYLGNGTYDMSSPEKWSKDTPMPKEASRLPCSSKNTLFWAVQERISVTQRHCTAGVGTLVDALTRSSTRLKQRLEEQIQPMVLSIRVICVRALSHLHHHIFLITSGFAPRPLNCSFSKACQDSKPCFCQPRGPACILPDAGC